MDDNEITAIVTGAPETIWQVYGDLERDDTHANCYREGDVGWCDETQYASDVRYVRADITEAENERLRAALVECQAHLACNAVTADLVTLYGRVRAALKA